MQYRRIFVCFLLSAAAVSIAGGQTKSGDSSSPTAVETKCSPGDDRELRQISERWREGYNRGNAAAVAALYAEDAYYLTQHFASGIVHPRKQIQAYIQHGTDAHYQIDSIEILALECSGKSAYTVTRYTSTNAGQKAVGVNLVVLRRVGGKWLIVAHESAVPDPATAMQNLDPPKGR